MSYTAVTLLCSVTILIPGMDVTLVVNNLGGTSHLELYLIANSALKYLGESGVCNPLAGKWCCNIMGLYFV